jgi:dihydrofolate synthase/folylpolyglutamate synthase
MDGYMTTEKEYQATLDYLYSFVDYSLTHNLNKTSFVDTLDDMLALDEEAGRPHQAYPCVHIAGTKGKGSTGALIAAALQAAGYKVGFYTSPHLEDFCERIQINRENISHSRFVG